MILQVHMAYMISEGLVLMIETNLSWALRGQGLSLTLPMTGDVTETS